MVTPEDHRAFCGGATWVAMRGYAIFPLPRDRSPTSGSSSRCHRTNSARQARSKTKDSHIVPDWPGSRGYTLHTSLIMSSLSLLVSVSRDVVAGNGVIFFSVARTHVHRYLSCGEIKGIELNILAGFFLSQFIFFTCLIATG